MNRRELIKLGAAMAFAPAVSAQRPAPTATSAPFKAGFAEEDITPELGMERPGGYGKSYHDKIHDPCKVRAVIFDDGSRRVALVGVDALLIPRNVVLEARKEIHQECGILPGSILIGASHSHSAGPIGMIQRRDYDHASPLVQRLAYEHSTVDDPRYTERVREQIVNAVCRADSRRVETRCGVHSGHEDRAAFNRRFRMKNGLTYTHPGQGNPEIIERAGPIDPEVGVIGAWDKDGAPLGCVVNYACHATTGPGGISADWIYYLEKTIRGAMGNDLIVVFLQGASGDVTQVDNLSPYARPSGEEYARFVGGRVGAEALKALYSAYPGRLTPLDARSTILNIKRRTPSPERLRRCLELVQQDPDKVGRTEWTFAKEIVMLDALIAKAPVAELEVQAIQVGPAVFLASPGEMFCQLGLDMKAGSSFPFTYPVELANGTAGYIPTEEALSERGGGYETRLTSYSNLEVTAGRQIVEAAVQLANRMKPGEMPTPPKAPPFLPEGQGIGSQPWSYGNVPAELQ